MSENKYMTVKETSKYSRFCETIVRQWTHSSNFYPAIRIGRRIVINREALDKWLEEKANNKN